jgi:hypothetical protein
MLPSELRAGLGDAAGHNGRACRRGARPPRLTCARAGGRAAPTHYAALALAQQAGMHARRLRRAAGGPARRLPATAPAP